METGGTEGGSALSRSALSDGVNSFGAGIVRIGVQLVYGDEDRGQVLPDGNRSRRWEGRS